MINDYSYLTQFKPRGYPVSHKRKVPFSPRITISREFTERINRVRELDQEFERFILRADDYLDLVVDAYASNIHWSTALEGNPLSEEEVRKVTRMTMTGRVEHPGGPNQEIINHLVNVYMPMGFQLPWTRETLCRLNEYLLEDTGNRSKVGIFRTTPAYVGDPVTGEEHFKPAPPEHIGEEIDSLLYWVNNDAPIYNPVIAASVMFHEFESIHPFEDGNGRTGRCLFHLYLKYTALKNSHLCKIDHKMLENSELYYDLLGYADQEGSYKELLDFISIALLRSYEEAYEELMSKDLLSSSLDETAKQLLIRARRHKDNFSIREARSWINGLSEQTIAKRLRELEAEGALESKGRTVGLRYRFKDPFVGTRELLQRRLREKEAGDRH
jgi:Fic family protein